MTVSRSFVLTLTLLTAVFAAALPAHAADHPETKGEAADTDHGHAEEKPELLRPASQSLILALTTLIVFVVLVALLGKTAWGPIAKGLQEREDKIRRDIEEAEAARARAEGTLRDYQAQLATAEQKVRELLAKATADAEQVAATLRARALQESQEIKDNATREIDSARRAAVRQVHEQAAVLSTRVAEKILRRNLNADDQRDLVAASLDQLETAKG